MLQFFNRLLISVIISVRCCFRSARYLLFSYDKWIVRKYGPIKSWIFHFLKTVSSHLKWKALFIPLSQNVSFCEVIDRLFSCLVSMLTYFLIACQGQIKIIFPCFPGRICISAVLRFDTKVIFNPTEHKTWVSISHENEAMGKRE
jgi:uncharacterized membrane protein